MTPGKQVLSHVHFDEHPFLLSGNPPPDELAILIDSDFSMSEYCKALFAKIISIGLSEVPLFLRYQCDRVKDPVKWINSLEKLIKLNVDFFDTKHLDHRHYKFISQIDLKRHELQTSLLVNHRTFHLRKSVSSFTEEREYCFRSIKDQLKDYPTYEEKIGFLHDQIFDYREDSLDFVSCKEKPFDVLCELEIEKLEKKESLIQKAEILKSKKSPETMPASKMKINGNVNYLVDVFYQMKERNILDATPSEIAAIINRGFLDKKGKEIPLSTILTILDPSRVEKRPKEGKRFKMK